MAPVRLLTLLRSGVVCFAMFGVAQSAVAQPFGTGIQVMPVAALAGTYVEPGTFPRVFMTPAKALALTSSSRPEVRYALARVTASVKAALANLDSYTTPYVGTDLATYLDRFSTTAAEAASQLALYAYLNQVNPSFGSADLAAQARTAAQAILLVWATESFQTTNGTAITSYTQFTSPGLSPAGVGGSVGLQIGRGLVYFTDALDMLNNGTIAASDLAALNQFVSRLLGVEIGASNYHYTNLGISFPQTGCARFDNQASTQMLALATMGQYLGRSDVIEAIAASGTSSLLDWSLPQQIEGTIYGYADKPRTCSPFSYYTPGQFYQTWAVAPGEIVDRYRAQPGQPFGYTLGNLLTLEETSDVMTRAGYDVSDFKGDHGQSLQTALDYYGQYVDRYLSYQPSNLPSTGLIANFSQYAGTQFTSTTAGASVQGKDALLPPFVLGQHLYPSDNTIAAALTASEALAQTYNTIPYVAMDVVAVSDWLAPMK